jgi:hypothetical protein
MDIKGLVELMKQQDQFNRVANNPLAMFGPRNRPLLGATLLPDKLVAENSFVEEGVRWRSPIANAGTRYSPVQKKGGSITSSVKVDLSHSDIGAEMTGADYDGVLRLIHTSDNTPNNIDNPTMAAVAAVTGWLEASVTNPMQFTNEKMRWDAIVDAQVELKGTGGYSETVAIADPSGHRVSAAGDWTDDNYDPMDDIVAMVDFAISKGATIDRIITSRSVISVLRKNEKIRERMGLLSIMGGTVTGLKSIATLTMINDLFASEGLPIIEEYNNSYETSTGNDWYLKRDVMVMVCVTGRDFSIQLSDAEPLILQNTLGYMAIGRAAGQPTSGRVTEVAGFSNKPPRIEAEGWQASFPVVLDPESIFVIKDIDLL